MLYYTNHPLNFVRSAAQLGGGGLPQCPFCKNELPNCDCGFGCLDTRKSAAKPKARKRQMGRKRFF